MKEPIFSRIETLSKKDRVVATLREAIVSGRMKPGDAVVEGKVARQLGVGQPVIREALLDLEHQGFVQRVPYRGTSVTKLGADEIEQIQQVRVELEGLAIELARARATPADIKALRAIVARCGRAPRRPTSRSSTTATWPSTARSGSSPATSTSPTRSSEQWSRCSPFSI